MEMFYITYIKNISFVFTLTGTENEDVKDAVMSILDSSTSGLGPSITHPYADLSHLPTHVRRLMQRDMPQFFPKEKRKPGPLAKTYRLRLYLLPPGSEIPQLTKNDPHIQAHQEQGYGYPANVEFGKHFKSAWDLYMSETDFKEAIRGCYPILQDKDFYLFTIDQQRMPKPVPFNVQYFKHQKYSGTVFIMIK